MWGIISNKRSERKKCVFNKAFLKHKKNVDRKMDKWHGLPIYQKEA